MNDPTNKSNRTEQTNAQTHVHTDGGSVTTGNAEVENGDFIGRDKVVNINMIFPNLTESFINVATEKAQDTLYDDKWQQFEWEAAEKAYRASLIKNYGRVSIIGRAQDVPLENIFTDVYILNEPTAYRRYDIDKLIGEGAEHFRTASQPNRGSSDRHQGIDLVTQGKNLYILGKPGAGKTTFLKQIATQGAKGRFQNKLPIFISLHDWTTGTHDDPLSYIVQQFDICHFPNARDFIEHLLQQGKGLLLFDGLDEVQREGNRRDTVTHLLKQFIHKYDKCQHLITCRVAANEYRFDGFWHVEMADFTEEQVNTYGEKWFGKNSRKYPLFIQALGEEQNQGVRELCNVPLLLSMICLYFDKAMAFPQRRAELYMDALDIILKEWDSSRAIKRDVIFYGGLSPQRKQQMLAHIATPAFEEGIYFFESHDLAQQIALYLSRLPGIEAAAVDIDGEAVLKEIAAQHGLLVEQASNIYSFSHLTFQEFFTARYIVENMTEGTTKVLINKHLIDQRWREVFLLVASLIDKGDDFCQTMRLEVDIFLTEQGAMKRMAVWSQSRVQDDNPTSDRRSSVRLAYMSLALDRARTCTLDIARSLNHALDLEHDLARARTLNYARALNRTLNHARALNRALNRTHAKNFDAQVGLDYGFYYAWIIAEIFAPEDTSDFWQHAKNNYATNFSQLLMLCKMAGDQRLAEVIAKLSVPQANRYSPPASWQKLTDALVELISDRRDLRMNWSFEKADLDCLNNYFYANELLVQCLDLAYVTDRQGFKNGLLLPPGEWARMTEAG